MRRRVLRGLLFAGPLVVWLAVALVFAGPTGTWLRSWHLLIRLLDTVRPGYPLQPGFFVSLYQLNHIFRDTTHVLLYGCLALLIVRAGQWGDPKPRARAFVAALGASFVATGIESLVRLRSPDRHVRLEQLGLNLLGTLIALLLAVLFFAIKAAERRLSESSDDTIAP
jgi:VanZ family protein